MRLIKARVQGYRSIIDTGYFDVENLKTIMVGPNESGKTAILQALQKLNPPKNMPLFDPLRDYPRSKYDTDIKHNGINPAIFTVVEGHFILDENEKKEMPEGFANITYVFGRYLNNSDWNRIENGIPYPKYSEIDKDLKRLSAHIDETFKTKSPTSTIFPSTSLNTITTGLNASSEIKSDLVKKLDKWLDDNLQYIDETNNAEEQRYDKLKNILQISDNRLKALTICKAKMPTFILFNNYFRIKPSIHLAKLAERNASNVMDDAQYDYGNNCLLKFLGFTADELSKDGDTSSFNLNDKTQFQQYKDKLDKRNYAINAATIRLTNAIIEVWNPKNNKKDANKLRIIVDGQYLKVVVEDELGVEVELDQRSEGFQWLVSFFVVFFAEAEDKHKNTILLLDEPGLSLHALKQVEFQETVTKLSDKNQTIFTTHSPFLIGVNELDIVRVVEMTDRKIGTIVNTSLTATDSGALLPLQEALGYNLAQSLFFHKKNMVLEGLTDYWYLEAISELLKEAAKTSLDENIAMLPANCASKVVYYATILHAQDLKVAALLDSDAEGETAATQDVLVNALGNKRILRTKSVYKGIVATPEIEDLFRETLIKIAKNDLGWDAENEATLQKTRPIVNIIADVAKKDFSKFKLAKAFLRWARSNSLNDLSNEEQTYAENLITTINKALK